MIASVVFLNIPFTPRALLRGFQNDLLWRLFLRFLLLAIRTIIVLGASLAIMPAPVVYNTLPVAAACALKYRCLWPRVVNLAGFASLSSTPSKTRDSFEGGFGGEPIVSTDRWVWTLSSLSNYDELTCEKLPRGQICGCLRTAFVSGNRDS